MTATPAENLLDEGQMEILRMAALCFMERGFAATSIDDVARKLGCTKGRIYHFFASKADLFFSVAEIGMEFNHKAIRACEHIAAPLDRLRAMALAHCLSMMETRAYQHAVWQGVEIHLRGATTPEQRNRLDALVESRDRYSDAFRAVMEEARARGELNYPDAGIARQLMLVALSSPMFWYKPRAGETIEDRIKVARQCVDFALSGLGAQMSIKK
jgi:AcrR family transcriptional regulator